MTTATTSPEAAARPSQPIVARSGTYYRWTRYVMATILLAYGGWSIHDGFITWPNWAVTHPNEKPKTAMDINFNRGLGVILPPLGILVLVMCLRNSRGEYRLEDDILYVPGHPPVPLDKINAADKELWDRKGIVYIEYDVEGSQTNRLKLDDFVYQREPTDQIFAEIQAALLNAPVMEKSKGFEVVTSTAPKVAPKAVLPAAAKIAQAAPTKPAPAKPAPAKPAAAPAAAKPDLLKAKTPPRPKLG